MRVNRAKDNGIPNAILMHYNFFTAVLISVSIRLSASLFAGSASAFSYHCCRNECRNRQGWVVMCKLMVV
jgi:hypothetical protein